MLVEHRDQARIAALRDQPLEPQLDHGGLSAQPVAQAACGGLGKSRGRRGGEGGGKSEKLSHERSIMRLILIFKRIFRGTANCKPLHMKKPRAEGAGLFHPDPAGRIRFA